jgi:hypothetical protein
MPTYEKSAKGYYYRIDTKGKKHRISASEYVTKRKQKGGDLTLDELIDLTRVPSPIIMSSTDVLKKDGFIQCKQCLARSGTNMIIEHYYNCKYAIPQLRGPFEYGKMQSSTVQIDPDLSEGVLQREYAEINKDSKIKWIGSVGAGPCVIVCVRDPITTRTVLAHIDSITIDPFSILNLFNKESAQIYVIGGDNSSRDMVHKILSYLCTNKWTIKFAHVIASSPCNFAINGETGSIYLNNYVHNINVNIDTEDRLRSMIVKMMFPTHLIEVNLNGNRVKRSFIVQQYDDNTNYEGGNKIKRVK